MATQTVASTGEVADSDGGRRRTATAGGGGQRRQATVAAGDNGKGKNTSPRACFGITLMAGG